MLLKNGSKGEDVKILQKKLGLTPDGDFGPATETKLKAWQTSNGLTSDGIVVDKTWLKLTGKKITISSEGLNLEALKGHISDAILDQIPDAAIKFGITTNLRLAHFLSQCGHESGGFKFTQENTNYSSDGLKKIFGKYFPGNTADSYSRNPEKIASRVYASRMGNGNEASNDGFKFRGRGFIQLTGRDNYTKFGDFIGEDFTSNPDLVATKYPLASAAFFFNNNSVWTLCDKGADIKTITAVSKKINGGSIGLEDRIKEFEKYYSLLS